MFFFFTSIFIDMGRKSLNRTYEEMLEIKRRTSNEYYKLHRNRIVEKRRTDYQKLKNDSIKQNIP